MKWKALAGIDVHFYVDSNNSFIGTAAEWSDGACDAQFIDDDNAKSFSTLAEAKTWLEVTARLQGRT